MIDGDRLFDVLHDLGFDGVFAEDDTEIRIACPLCADDNKRLYIEADSGLWICFRCDERGGLFALFNEAIGLQVRESFAMQRAVQSRPGPRYYFETGWVDGRPEEKEPPKVELPEEFVPFGKYYTSPYTRYLQDRGVGHETRLEYSMGYCDHGPYAGRVIIPVYGATSGALYSFVARSIDPDEPKKVLYPPHSRPSETLFNLSNLLIGAPYEPPYPSLVLMEGVFDALALPQCAVAILGATLSTAQLDLLQVLCHDRRPFVVCMDGDDAGRKASKAIMKQLWSNMLPAVEAVLPDGTDPGSLSTSTLRKIINKAVESA